MNGTQGAQTADSKVQQTADGRQRTAVQRDSEEVLVKYIVQSTYKTLHEEGRKENKNRKTTAV